MRDVTALLITHIHLDHSGSAGTLVRENPNLRVLVHAKGAPHLIEPGKLLASATRLYGDAMDRLWGEVAPVPEQALVVVQGGERVEAGGRSLEVAYTPGHASHHVSYFAPDAGIAFVGDTAGVKVVPDGDVRAADAAARCRPRSVVRQPGPHRAVGAGVAVPDAFRPDRRGRESSEHAARSIGGRQRLREGVTRARGQRRGARDLVRRGMPPPAARAHERQRRACVRSG